MWNPKICQGPPSCGRDDLVLSCEKVFVCVEVQGHKILKSSLNFFDTTKWDIKKSLMAFSEYLNLRYVNGALEVYSFSIPKYFIK